MSAAPSLCLRRLLGSAVMSAGLVIALVFTFALGVWESVAQARAVKVGCLYPLTGPGGLYGRDSAVAIRLAERHIRARLDEGYPELEISIEDTRSKSLRSLQIARRFVTEDKVDFLCGVVSSGIAFTVSEYAKTSQTFFIGTDHASSQLVSSALHPFYFRVSNDTRQSMLAGAKYIRDHYGASEIPLRIAFIGPDYDYGYHAWDDLRRFLRQEGVGYQIVGEFWPKLFETDFNAYIRALNRAKPDIVVNGHWGLDLVAFVKQATQLGLFKQAQFMNFDAGGNYEVLSRLGADMPLGIVLSARHHLNWPDTEANASFVATFHEEAGRYPSYAAEGAYAGVLAIAEAVRAAGGVADKDRLRAALRGLRLKLPEDPDGFISFMDPSRHQLMQVQAIGRTIRDTSYPPAQTVLGHWSVYPPPKNWPNGAPR